MAKESPSKKQSKQPSNFASSTKDTRVAAGSAIMRTTATSERASVDPAKSGPVAPDGKSGKKQKKQKPAGDRKGRDDGKKASQDGTKPKLVRDSFTMPEPDYALISTLKAQALAVGVSVKKSELLRAGLGVLSRMPTAQLAELIGAMPKLKTGRPKKKKK